MIVLNVRWRPLEGFRLDKQFALTIIKIYFRYEIISRQHDLKILAVLWHYKIIS